MAVPFGLNSAFDKAAEDEAPSPSVMAMTEGGTVVIPPPATPQYPWYLDTSQRPQPPVSDGYPTWLYIPGGPHGDFQYGGGATDELLKVQDENRYLARMEAIPLGNGAVRLNWSIPNVPNIQSYSWLAICRSLYGAPVSVLESLMVYRAPRSTAYSTFIDAGLPHGREVCYTLFVLTTDPIERWIPIVSKAIVTANDPWFLNSLRMQLPAIYWEKDLLQAEAARIPGNDAAEPDDGALWRYFDLLGPEILTSKAFYDCLASLRDPQLCPSSLLPELAKLMGGLEFIRMPPERLREVLGALVTARKRKGTAEAYSAILSAVMNCPVEVLDNTNLVLDINSSQEFYSTASTRQPGFWWPGDNLNATYQIAPNGVTRPYETPAASATTRWIEVSDWINTDGTTTPTAGHISLAPTWVYVHKLDKYGVDQSIRIETAYFASQYIFTRNMDNETDADYWKQLSNVEFTKVGDVYQLPHPTGTIHDYPGDATVRLYFTRFHTAAPVPVAGDGLLVSAVKPNGSPYVVRSVPPGPTDATGYPQVRDYGIPVTPGEFYLLSGYVMASAEATVVEAVIEFWDKEGYLDFDRLTKRTYINIENEYDTHLELENNVHNVDRIGPGPEWVYLDLLKDPLGVPPASGAVPGATIKSFVPTTNTYTYVAPPGTPVQYVRPWVLVQAPIDPPAERLVMRFYGDGPGGESVLYLSAIQLERLSLEDFPRSPTGTILWDTVGPAPYQAARTVNTVIHPYRYNMISNPNGSSFIVGPSGFTDEFAQANGVLAAGAWHEWPHMQPTYASNVYTVESQGLICLPDLSGDPHTLGTAQWLSEVVGPVQSIEITVSAVKQAFGGTNQNVLASFSLGVQRSETDSDYYEFHVTFYGPTYYGPEKPNGGVAWSIYGPDGTELEIDAPDIALAEPWTANTSYTLRFESTRVSATASRLAAYFNGTLLGTITVAPTGGAYIGFATEWRQLQPAGVSPRIERVVVGAGGPGDDVNQTNGWLAVMEPPTPLVIMSEVVPNLVGVDTSVMTIDHEGPPFGIQTTIDAEYCEYFYSMIGVKFTVRPAAAGRFRFRVLLEFKSPDYAETLYTTHWVTTVLGTDTTLIGNPGQWTSLFHAFEISVPKPFALALSIVLLGEDNEATPTDWAFSITDVMVDDITSDLPYFDGDTPSTDDEFGWLGTSGLSPSGAWPLRERRELYVPVIASHWLPAAVGWSIAYDDGRVPAVAFTG